MNALLLAMLLPASTWIRPAEPPVDAATLASYASRCKAGAASAECLGLQARIELELYATLRGLRGGDDVGDEIWRVALAAREPRLRAFALEHAAAAGIDRADEALVVESLFSPFPGVRDAALAAATRLSDPRWARMGERRAHDGRRDGLDEVQKLLEPDPLPDARTLGAPPYPGSRYVYLASSAERAVFLTKDGVAEVLRFYTKGGKRVVDAPALREKPEPTQADAMRMAQEMQAAMARGEDPQKAMAKMMQGYAGSETNWTEGLEGVDGIGEARYVAYEEKTVGGRRVPTRVVAVCADEVLRGTVVVLRPVPDLSAVMRAPTTDMETFQRRQRIMMLSSMPYEE